MMDDANINDELDFALVQKELITHMKSEIDPRLPLGYEITTFIGEGGIGAVYTARNKDDGNFLAVKVVRSMINEILRRKIKEEYRIQKKLKHRNIAEVYGLISTSSFISIFMECLTGGDLFDMIPINQGINIRDGFIIFQQLLDAVEYCHTRNIVHLDIKPENVMISSSKVPKLIDFGVAVDHTIKPNLKDHYGTTAYSAPETFLNREYTGFKADLFSLTVTFLTAITGERCWNIASYKDDHYYCWQDKRWVISTFQRLPADLLNFLIGALAHNPLERYSIDQIKSHMWYKQGLKGEISAVKAQVNSQWNNIIVPNSQPMLPKDILNTSFEAACVDYDFPLSQPIDFAKLLIPSSIKDSGTDFASIVKRMTRFFSTLECDVTLNKVQILIEQHKQCIIKHCQNNIINVQSVFTDFEVFFRVFIFKFGDSTLVDFRRVRGDGFLFHNIFAEVLDVAKQLGFVDENHPNLKKLKPK